MKKPVKPLVIAHRGASAYARENTMASFELAVAMGADMIELDVRKTGDGILLVHHDPYITCGEKRYYLNRLSLARILELKGFEVPTLGRVLEHFGHRVQLDIEIKEVGYEEEVLNLVLKNINPGSFVITSFNDYSVSRIKKINPVIKTGLLLGLDKPEHIVLTRIKELMPWKRHRLTGADFLAPHYKLVNPVFLRICRTKYIPVFVWTVDEPRLISKLMKNRVEAIITNKPDLAIKIRRDRALFKS